MTSSSEHHIAMDLIADNYNAFLITDMSHLAQCFNVPAFARRVVGIAKYHHLASLYVATQSFEIHSKRCLCSYQMIPDNHTFAAFRNNPERMIDRLLNQYFVAFLCESLHGKVDTAYYSRYIVDVTGRDVPVEVRTTPVDNALIIRFWGTGISKDLLLKTILNGPHHKRRSLEIHICHPHWQHIFASAHFLDMCIFIGVGAFAFDYFVEVVFHVH